MLAQRRKLAAMLAAALLLPVGVACDSDTTPTDLEEESDEGTDAQPGTVETTRPEEG